MKKLIQIALIALLVFGLFQAAAGAAEISSVQADLGAVNTLSSEVHPSTAGVEMSACLVRIKGVICVKPNVGWNS